MPIPSLAPQPIPSLCLDKLRDRMISDSKKFVAEMQAIV